jgi:hypothetical protein
MQSEIAEIKRTSFFSRLPKWLRITFIILSIITMIYWICWLFFHIWKAIGKALHWISDPRNWWIYTSVVLILAIGGLLLAQFCSDLKPFTHLWKYVEHLFDIAKKKIIKTID